MEDPGHDMKSARGAVIRRRLREVIVITGSIFLAFSLDRWWDWQRDRIAEKALLVSLVEEFGATNAELNDLLLKHERRRDAAVELMRLSAASVSLISADSLATLWNAAIVPNRTDTPKGVLASAIASGKLELIRNEQLRGILAGWNDRLLDTSHTEHDLANYLLGSVLPDLATQAPLPYLDLVADRAFGIALVGQPARNHFGFIALISQVAVDENRGLERQASEILALLHAELQ